MSSSKNKYYQQASNEYKAAVNAYGGDAGYNRAYKNAQGKGNEQIRNATDWGKSLTSEQMANSNAAAKQYAGQQASATAAGAQSQATTAARAAGMNKAQAAMLGAQQNANAFQNAYGNAYNSQLGSYNNNYLNNTNIANNNTIAQQQLAQQSNQNLVNAYGNMMGAAQQEGQNEYNRKNANWGLGLGLLGFSDERLKHYRECSKKVVMRTPSKMQALKITIDKKGE